MGGIFFALRFFPFVLVLAGSSLFCADVSADQGNTGAAITGRPALPLPPRPAAGVPVPAEAEPRPPRAGGDYVTFRDNVRDHPDISALALISLLGRLPPDRTDVFVTRHYSRIAELVVRLDEASGAGGLPPESYAAITSGLSRFQINTKGAAAAGKNNPLDEVINLHRTRKSEDRRQMEADAGALRKRYPGHPGVQAAVAQYYSDMKNYEMAARTATDGLGLDPGNPDLYKTRALARSALQDRRGAIEDIRKAMEMDPQDESARILSALVNGVREPAGLKTISSLDELRGTLDRSGVPGAVKSGEGVRAGVPDGTDVSGALVSARDHARYSGYLKTASSKNQLGDYEEAAKYAGLAIEKNPEGQEGYLERANAYNFLGRYEEAVKDTTRVIDRDPSNAQALNMRAWALNRLGMAKDAETDAGRAIGINPGFADAWFNRALAYEKQGDYKRMLEDFRQAASLNGAYGARFQDAVAQYSDRVPDFSYGPAGPLRGGRDTGRTRFLVLLGFTLTGGLLVAMGLLHVATSAGGAAAASGSGKALAGGKRTHPDTLSPSVFYEGVATGKYKIDRKIGEGGMGVVYEAVDQSLDRKVAIKKMHDEIKSSAREKQRFLDEARTVALLHHPNIVGIHTIFEEGDNIYLVFEHVAGVTLDMMLERAIRLPFGKARKIFEEAAGALSYAHSKGVVHRDLKLSNIMVSDEDEIKIMDFGLAGPAARVPSGREVVGSPAYMPPEQDLGLSTKESDIYSLGVCLYETLTGSLPFKGPDFHFQKEHGLYQPAGAAVPGLPGAVDELLARALAPNPADRFQTAADFRKALLDISA